MIKKLLPVLAMTFFLYGQGPAFGYDDKVTHPELTEVAIDKSNLNAYLKNYLGITEGKDKIYNGDTIVGLLQAGSTNEDLRYRALNHFLNPIHNEGLDDQGFFDILIIVNLWWHFTGLSNLDWAMGEAQDGTILDDCGEGDHSLDHDCNDYSWRRARDLYYEALVSSSKKERDQKFVEFYEKLGRVLHLLEDTGVPAHTRNDMLGHLDFTKLEGSPIGWYGNLYEFWVKEKLKANQGYVADLCQNVNKPVFLKPEDYWDKDVYVGSDPNITLPVNGEEQSGLAEYSNANFLSKCTMFTEDLPFGDNHYFPYPNEFSISQMTPQEVIGQDGNVDKVLYLTKDKDGEVIENFVAAKYVWTHLYITLTDIKKYYQLAFKLDDKVHEAYAEKLIPKTVGYTAGLIDYFFRGTLEVTAPEEYVYSIIDGSKLPHQFKYIKANVKNTTPDDEIGTGIIQAIARYKRRTDYRPDLSTDPPTPESREADFSYSLSAPIEITSLSSTAPEEFVFDFTDNPIPAGITDLYLHVIFKGTLGSEADNAIALGMVDLNEPQHFSIWNATDMFYLDGVLWTTDEIKNSLTLLLSVDLDVDGIINETDIGEPYIEQHDVTTYVAFYHPAAEFPTLYNAAYTPLPPERYGSIIILTDMPYFYLHIHRKSTTLSEEFATDFLYSGVINQENNGIFENTQVHTFRGIIQHQWSAYSRYYPYVEGISTAPWPETEITEPYPASAISP